MHITRVEAYRDASHSMIWLNMISKFIHLHNQQKPFFANCVTDLPQIQSDCTHQLADSFII